MVQCGGVCLNGQIARWVSEDLVICVVYIRGYVQLWLVLGSIQEGACGFLYWKEELVLTHQDSLGWQNSVLRWVWGEELPTKVMLIRPGLPSPQ